MSPRTPTSAAWLRPSYRGVEAEDARWLRALLRQALRASFASSLVLVGCQGGAGGAPPVSAMQQTQMQPGEMPSPQILPASQTLTRPGCEAGRWQLADALILAQRVDFLADVAGGQRITSVGEPCSGATDAAACQLALGAAVLPNTRHLLTTQGDDVRIWTAPGASALIGAVTTEAEAIWTLEAQGHTIACDAEITGDGANFVIDSASQTTGMCVSEASVVEVHRDGTSQLASGQKAPKQSCAVSGREPAGLVARRTTHANSALGEHFAAMAYMEAASVPAFATLGLELALHGAPAALSHAAALARQDELRHAFIAATLAGRYQATATRAHVHQQRARDLEAVALENAVEGCVRETYAALVAHHQALAAGDPQVRRALHAIAEDETRHAALSHAVARWVTPQLTRAATRRVHAAQREAVEQLRRDLQADVAAELRTSAGIPDPAVATRLHAHLRSELWARS